MGSYQAYLRTTQDCHTQEALFTEFDSGYNVAGHHFSLSDDSVEQIPNVPCLTITSPTPEMPKSPILASRSPLTVSKYVAAAHSATATSSMTQRMIGAPVPAPLLPECLLCDPQGRSRCETCEQQWLACKLWYHSNDSGHAKRLKEPYTIPAASNASSRAMAASLGYPVGSARGLGLELGNGQTSVQSQAMGSRFSGSDIQGPDEWGRRRPSRGRAFHFARRTARRRYSVFSTAKLAQNAKAAWKSVNTFLKTLSKRNGH